LRTSGRASAALAALIFAIMVRPAFGQTGSLTVHVDRPGVKISPMLYGLMTEEINHAYDGGLYAELIRNRAFKDDQNRPVHWSAVGGADVALDTTQPVNSSLLVSLKVTAAGNGRAGVANEGFWGIPVNPNTRYRASFYARASAGFKGPLTVWIESADGSRPYARASVSGLNTSWRRFTADLKTGPNVPASTANRFVISTLSPGTIDLSLVSLFPPTIKNRPNGLRPDLMQLMADMKPAFLRFPGGNYLEGNTIAERFDWKKTLGPIQDRPGHQCPWGYRSTDGMGLLEFLTWCEDLKAEPVLCVFGGYALRGEYVAPGPALLPHVQDALDEIEYVSGDSSTRWGARRAMDGHPAPFKLRYVEIGNEDWFDRSGSYDGRFAQFHDAIKAKHPQLQTIATAPVRSRTPDVIDDHYYRSARDMERDAHHYDRASRTGPKIFVGEWATTEGSPTPTMQAALGDAAWLTGMERNSDLIIMSCYAPLLVNVNPGARQWGTNLIGYDALRSFGSTSYYVQTMFNNNRGDRVLPVEVVAQKKPEPPPPAPKGAIGVGTWLTQSEYRDLKVTQGDRVLYEKDFANGTGDWRTSRGTWAVQDGVLRQTSNETDCRAVAGDRNWTDYTYRVRARKLSGAEGFLILFHVEGRDDFLWWNIGGWGNSRTAIERAKFGSHREIGTAVPVRVETGRWYDIRIELRGTSVRCYLDDKLIQEAEDTAAAPVDPLYSTASRDNTTGDVIVKVVNVSASAQDLDVRLEGVRHVTGGTAEILQGNPADVNSVENPRKVAPQTGKLKLAGPTLRHTFPPHSLTVLRVRTKR
jgi:alpha-L-arabinofuranosidase